MHTARLVPAVVAVTLVVAGCLAAPTDGPARDRVVEFGASNAAAETYLVTFSLAATPHGFAATDVNNSTTRYPNASSLDEVPEPVVSRAVRVVPLGDDVRTFGLRLRPGDGVGNTVRSLPRDTVVVYTVANPAREEPMRAIGLATCGPGTTDSTVDVRIDADGAVHVDTSCRD
jgi:hypothetical protein